MRHLLLIPLLATLWTLGYQPSSSAAQEKTVLKNAAVQANNDFACDVFKSLDQASAGKNLFFSPYSISIALAMTLEGARGDTAQEMGKVLRLPASLGSGDAMLPWSLAPYHQGFSDLNRRLTEAPNPLQDQANRKKLADMRKQLGEINARTLAVEKQGKFQELAALQTQAQKLAASINAVQKLIDPYDLRIANALWGEKTYPFEQKYLDAVAKHHGSGLLRQADFRNDFPGERAKINGWVEDQTKKRIKDLVPDLPPDVGQRVKLILVNAIYFKGQWATPFEPKQTKMEPFLLTDGVKKTVSMMHGTSKAGYAAFSADGSYFNTPLTVSFDATRKEPTYPERDGFFLAELPVQGDKLSMVVIAPQNPKGLSALEEKLTGANLSAWLGKIQKRSVNITLPKFKLETDYGLHDHLKKMGMELAFAERKADFTGMSASRDPDDRLSISKVLHKAFVEVNEQGAEAAAATAVIMVTPTSAPVSQPFTPNFRADRPFLFLIRDIESGAVLFLGRVTQPN